MITLHDFDQKKIRETVEKLLQPQQHSTELVVDGDGGSPRRQTRREHIRERFKIMHDDFDDLAESWISEVWREKEILSELKRHVLPLFNPPKRATDRLAVAYTHHPIRRIRGDEDGTARWNASLLKSRFNLHMRSFNRGQVAYNSIVVLPLLRRGNMFDYQVVTGAIAERFSDTDLSDFDPPDVLFWRTPWFSGEQLGTPAVYAVDSEYYVAFDRAGNLIRDLVKHHGLGMFPGALFRNTIPGDTGTSDDAWWDPWPNKGAYRAMESVTRVVANLDWTRKTQCRHLIAEIIDDESKSEGVVTEQVLGDAEGVLRLRGEAVQLAVNNISTAIDSFKDHIRFFQDEALEVMTGAVASLSDPDQNNPFEAQGTARGYAAINLHRVHQINFLHPADLRLQRVMAAILSKVRSVDAVAPEKLLDEGELEYVQPPYIDDPEKRLNWYILAAKFGVVDQVDYYSELQGCTEEEALEKLLQKQKRRVELRKLQTNENMPADPTQEEDPALPGESLPERQGRAGGRSSPPSQAEAVR